MAKSKKWSKTEINYLCENWGERSYITLSRHLKRSIAAIRIKAFKLGLKRLIHQGEYITYNQLNLIIHKSKGHNYDKKLIRAGIPIEKIKIVNSTIKIIYLDKFFDWFKKNKHLISIHNTVKGDFGACEPDWLEEKRKADKLASVYTAQRKWTKEEDNKLIEMLNAFKYGYREISTALKRTEGAIKRRMKDLKLVQRPLRAESKFWSEEEIKTVKDLYLKGYESCIIAEYIPKSALAINGVLERNNYFAELL